MPCARIPGSAGKGVTDDGLFDLLYATSLAEYGLETAEAEGRFRRVMSRLQELIAMDVGALTFWQYLDTNRYFTLMSLIGVGSVPRVYGVFLALFDWSTFWHVAETQGLSLMLVLPRTATVRAVSGFEDTDPLYYYCFLIAYFTADITELFAFISALRSPTLWPAAIMNSLLKALAGLVPMVGFTLFWYITPRFFINFWVTATLVSVVITTIWSSIAACLFVTTIAETGANPKED